MFTKAESVTYTWPLSWHGLRFVPWLLLLLLVVASGSTRTGAWRAAVPAAGLLVAVVLSDLYWDAAAYYVDGLALVAYSLSCLWLVSGRVARMRGGAAAVLAFLWLVASGVVYLLFSTGLLLDSSVIPDDMPAPVRFMVMVIAHTVLALVMVLVFPVARRWCKGAFTWPRFYLRLVLAALMLAVIPVPLVALGAAMLAYVYDEGLVFVLEVIGAGVAGLLGIAITLLAVLLPYLAITRRTPVLDRRFCEMMRLDQPRPREKNLAMPAGVAPERKEAL